MTDVIPELSAQVEMVEMVEMVEVTAMPNTNGLPLVYHVRGSHHVRRENILVVPKDKAEEEGRSLCDLCRRSRWVNHE